MEFVSNLATSPEIMSLLMLAVGAFAGYGLKALRNLIAKSENKLDDAIWNKLVAEFTAVGAITPDQLKELKAMPSGDSKAQK